MDAVLLTAGAIIMFGTAAVTASRYGDLPETIPIHFGLDGTVNGYGPRATAWILVAAQVAIALGSASVYVTAGVRGILVMGVCMLLILLRVQLLILSAAMTGAKRAPIGRSAFFILAALAIGIFAATRG